MIWENAIYRGVAIILIGQRDKIVLIVVGHREVHHAGKVPKGLADNVARPNEHGPDLPVAIELAVQRLTAQKVLPINRHARFSNQHHFDVDNMEIDIGFQN